MVHYTPLHRGAAASEEVFSGHRLVTRQTSSDTHYVGSGLGRGSRRSEAQAPADCGGIGLVRSRLLPNGQRFSQSRLCLPRTPFPRTNGSTAFGIRHDTVPSTKVLVLTPFRTREGPAQAAHNPFFHSLYPKRLPLCPVGNIPPHLDFS